MGEKMKHFVYFSTKAPTSGKFDVNDLMGAGRLDIAIHSLIQGIFLSHDFRKDVKFHFVFYGMPDPPKHIEIQVVPDLKINKRNIGELIKKILYKSKGEGKQEIFPGCFVERKSFLKVIDELSEEGNEIFILDKKGESLRDVEIPENCVFVLGDQEGLPGKEFKRIKQSATSVSVGPKMYFASQVVAIVNNELDFRGI
jgi:tRNA (pseudouridine54-N1)-methyltransferase